MDRYPLKPLVDFCLRPLRENPRLYVWNTVVWAIVWWRLVSRLRSQPHDSFGAFASVVFDPLVWVFVFVAGGTGAVLLKPRSSSKPAERR